MQSKHRCCVESLDFEHGRAGQSVFRYADIDLTVRVDDRTCGADKIIMKTDQICQQELQVESGDEPRKTGDKGKLVGRTFRELYVDSGRRPAMC